MQTTACSVSRHDLFCTGSIQVIRAGVFASGMACPEDTNTDGGAGIPLSAGVTCPPRSYAVYFSFNTEAF